MCHLLPLALGGGLGNAERARNVKERWGLAVPREEAGWAGARLAVSSSLDLLWHFKSCPVNPLNCIDTILVSHSFLCICNPLSVVSGTARGARCIGLKLCQQQNDKDALYCTKCDLEIW